MQAQESINHDITVRRRTVFIAAMAALLAVFFVLLFCGNVWSQTDIVYMSGRDRMADALHTEEYARTLDPYEYARRDTRVPFKDGNYPPLAYVFFYLMDAASGRDVSTPRAMVVAVFCTAAATAMLLHACLLLTRAERKRRVATAIALLLCGPVAFAFERGNIILLAAAFCGYFLAGYRSQRRAVRELAFIALAIAAALKIFPALLGLLLLRERRFAEAARLMLYGIIAVFAPFLLLEGGFRGLPLLFSNFQAHTAYYTRLLYPRFGLRLYAALAYDVPWANAWLAHNAWRYGEKLLLITPYIDALFSCGCVLTALMGRRDWQRALAIMLIVINYPVNSGIYTALYLLPVIAMYLSCEVHERGERWVFAAFILILSPVQIPFPAFLMPDGETILCSLSDILRNLAAYALFAACAVQGVLHLVEALREKRTQKGRLQPAG